MELKNSIQAKQVFGANVVKEGKSILKDYLIDINKKDSIILINKKNILYRSSAIFSVLYHLNPQIH